MSLWIYQVDGNPSLDIAMNCYSDTTEVKCLDSAFTYLMQNITLEIIQSYFNIVFILKVGWQGKFFWLIRISVSQHLPESNKSLYWAGDVVKNTVKSWNSQMNFHSVEIFPCDVNCRKRHHSGSTLLHMRACAIGSQSNYNFVTLLTTGIVVWARNGPKNENKNLYEFIEFSLFLTLSLPRNQSEWY